MSDLKILLPPKRIGEILFGLLITVFDLAAELIDMFILPFTAFWAYKGYSILFAQGHVGFAQGMSRIAVPATIVFGLLVGGVLSVTRFARIPLTQISFNSEVKSFFMAFLASFCLIGYIGAASEIKSLIPIGVTVLIIYCLLRVLSWTLRKIWNYKLGTNGAVFVVQTERTTEK